MYGGDELHRPPWWPLEEANRTQFKDVHKWGVFKFKNDFLVTCVRTEAQCENIGYNLTDTCLKTKLVCMLNMLKRSASKNNLMITDLPKNWSYFCIVQIINSWQEYQSEHGKIKIWVVRLRSSTLMSHAMPVKMLPKVKGHIYPHKNASNINRLTS